MEKFVTPEGVLKHNVLSSVSSNAVKYATGVLNPAHGVLGMGESWTNDCTARPGE